MELVNQVRGFLAPVGQLFVPMRQPAVVAMKTRYRGTCRSGNMLFDDQLVGARAPASFFPFSCKIRQGWKNCNPQVAARVVPLGRLNLYARSRKHRSPATDRMALQQTRGNNCVGK